MAPTCTSQRINEVTPKDSIVSFKELNNGSSKEEPGSSTHVSG